MPYFRQTAILIAATLAAAIGAAQAQTTVITREQPVQTETVVTQQPQQPLQLTPLQRQTVYRTIVRERAVPTQQTAVSYHVGTRVPQTTQLYAVPETVAVEVPEVRSYKYMVVNDQVVLVDPPPAK